MMLPLIHPRNKPNLTDKAFVIFRRAYCRGLVGLANDKGLRAEMAIRGRAFVECNHSMERYKDVIQLYSNEVELDASMSWKDSGLAFRPGAECRPEQHKVGS